MNYSSVALDHLTKYEIEDPGTCVIFAYYSYRYPERHSLCNLLGAFIRQLAAKKDQLPDDVQVFFREFHRNAKTPKVGDMVPIFNELIKLFPSTVFIVIDALDECENNLREYVLDFIIQLASEQSTIIKIFVTSRRERDIKEAFDQCQRIEIDTTSVNADIRTFLQDEIESRLQKKRLRLQDQQLKVTILDKLTSRVDGM